jgi:hypothetical protein
MGRRSDGETGDDTGTRALFLMDVGRSLARKPW